MSIKCDLKSKTVILKISLLWMQLCDNDVCTLSSFFLRSLWCLLTVFLQLATITVGICSRNITNISGRKNATTESTECVIQKLYLPSHRTAAHLLGHRTFLPIPLFQTDDMLLLPQQHSYRRVNDAIPIWCPRAWCHSTLLVSGIKVKIKTFLPCFLSQIFKRLCIETCIIRKALKTRDRGPNWHLNFTLWEDSWQTK